MSPKYKLTYFRGVGRAESIRMLLAYGNQEFDDCFIEKDKWPQIKPTMPFGKVPILEVDGKVFHQSDAICRYLAKEFGLAGSNDEESLEIDMIVNTFEDWTTEMRNCIVKEAEEEKAAGKKKISAEIIPYYASKFEEIVTSNGGYFVCGKLSWADIRFVTLICNLMSMLGLTDILENYPSLKCLKEKVLEEPNIKAWLGRREPLS